MVAGKISLPANCVPVGGIKVGDSLLSFPEGQQAILNDLLESQPGDIGSKNLAILNLLCAPFLPGSENLGG